MGTVLRPQILLESTHIFTHTRAREHIHLLKRNYVPVNDGPLGGAIGLGDRHGDRQVTDRHVIWWCIFLVAIILASIKGSNTAVEIFDSAEKKVAYTSAFDWQQAKTLQ